MAVVRARSSPPYGAFAGFFLFGITAVAAVVFYIMWAKAVDDASSAQKAIERTGTTKEMADFQSAYAAAYPTSTGQTASLLKQAHNALDDMGSKLADATRERDSLRSQVATRTKAAEDAQRAAAESEAGRQALSAQMKSAQEDFAKAEAALSDQNLKLSDQVAAANRERDRALAEGQDALNKAQAAFEDKNRDNVLAIEQDKNEIATRDKEIFELRQRIINTGGRGVNTSVGEPDSTIVRVNQATGECYIMLGKKDRVVPGLTFTAYDPRLGVRYGTDEQAAGNGSMEVIDVGETTSLCRITHTTPGRAIQVGDLIANPVYHNDRTRQFRFVVRGDFDLDGDNVATAAERDRIVRLIISWGGKVDDKVTPQTDFIVMGARPTNIAPVEDASATTTPAAAEPGSVADQRKKDQDDYDDVVVQGKRLAIPVLNANRFLAMVGYYNTTIVRYDNKTSQK